MGKKKVKKEGEKFTRTYIACDFCREKHNKCDGARPLCCHCKRTGQTECTYRRHRPLSHQTNAFNSKIKAAKKLAKKVAKQKGDAESEFILHRDTPTTEDSADSNSACKREKTETNEKRADKEQNPVMPERKERADENTSEERLLFSELSAFFGVAVGSDKGREDDVVTSYTVTNTYNVVSPHSPDTSSSTASPHASPLPPTPQPATYQPAVQPYEYQQPQVAPQQQMYAAAQPAYENHVTPYVQQQQPNYIVQEQVNYQHVPQQQQMAQYYPQQQKQVQQMQQTQWPQQRKRKPRGYSQVAPAYVQVYNTVIPSSDPYCNQYYAPNYFPPQQQQVYAPQYYPSQNQQGFYMPQNGYVSAQSPQFYPNNFYGNSGAYSEPAQQPVFLSSKKKEVSDFVCDEDDEPNPIGTFVSYETVTYQ